MENKKSNLILEIVMIIILMIISFFSGIFIGKNSNNTNKEKQSGEVSYDSIQYGDTNYNTDNKENYVEYTNDYNDNAVYNETESTFKEEFNHVDDVANILDDSGNNTDLKNRRKKIIKDELDYGEDYMKFSNFELYSRKPDRIIFKQGNKDGFFIFEKDDKAYEHLLVVSEDRMAYSVMSDFNLWCFTPDSIDKMTKSGENYIIYDFDNDDLSEFDVGFQKDVIFRFSSENRLYRLVSYLAEFKEAVQKDKLGKNEFATNTEISGYKYMMYDGFQD